MKSKDPAEYPANTDSAAVLQLSEARPSWLMDVGFLFWDGTKQNWGEEVLTLVALPYCSCFAGMLQ